MENVMNEDEIEEFDTFTPEEGAEEIDDTIESPESHSSLGDGDEHEQGI
jgi:hypothetical protein